MTRFSAPGKLYIAGEYAVVTPGEPAILIAVDRCIHVDVREVGAEAVGSVSSTLYPSALTWSVGEAGQAHLAGADGEHDDLVAEAIRLTSQLAHLRGVTPRPLHLDITSELVNPDGVKLGLGSSGAVTVAVIHALCSTWQLNLTIEQRFRLALLVTLRFSPRASGGDLAASTLGGWVRYSAPDRAALATQLATEGLETTLTSHWEGLELTRLHTPTSVQVVVGWTGSPADTDHLVARQRSDSDAKQTLLASSRIAVQQMTRGLDDDDALVIMQAYAASRDALLAYDAETGGAIETEALAKLREIAEAAGAIAKPSGAGGGDCGVVMCESHIELHRMKSEWHNADITELGLSAYPQEDPR